MCSLKLKDVEHYRCLLRCQYSSCSFSNDLSDQCKVLVYTLATVYIVITCFEMFSLIYGLYEYLTRKEELHILMIGLDRSGKTQTLERLKALYTDSPGLSPDKVLPTVGLNIGRFSIHNSPLVFWDLGGAAGLRSIWEKYYAEAHAVIFVVDASDPRRFDESKAVLDKVLRDVALHCAPLLVLANKQDAPGAVAAIEMRERLGISRHDNGRAVNVQSASAIDGDGLTSGVEWLVDRIKKSHRLELLRRKLGAQ